jgi:ferritin-like metal-binding protein YciE
MAQKKLQDAFIDELRDTYDAEKQLTKALPKMAKAATSSELKAAFTNHLEETRSQIERLEQVFELLGERPRGKHCEGIAGIIEEGASMMEEDFDEATMDAALIAGGQRAEHYEMAAYGTLVAWARELGHMEAGELLDQTLEEEKAADLTLSAIAQNGVNPQAASGSSADDEDEEDEDEETETGEEARPARRSARAGASRSARSTASRR